MTSDVQQILDTRAIELSTESITLVRQHITTCSARDKEIAKGMERIHARLDTMIIKGLSLVAIVVTILLGALGWSLSELWSLRGLG